MNLTSLSNIFNNLKYCIFRGWFMFICFFYLMVTDEHIYIYNIYRDHDIEVIYIYIYIFKI